MQIFINSKKVDRREVSIKLSNPYYQYYDISQT